MIYIQKEKKCSSWMFNNIWMHKLNTYQRNNNLMILSLEKNWKKYKHKKSNF